MKWGDYPGLSDWAQCNHMGTYKREVVRSESGKDVLTEAEVGVICFEGRGSGAEPRNASSP